MKEIVLVAEKIFYVIICLRLLAKGSQGWDAHLPASSSATPATTKATAASTPSTASHSASEPAPTVPKPTTLKAPGSASSLHLHTATKQLCTQDPVVMGF